MLTLWLQTHRSATKFDCARYLRCQSSWTEHLSNDAQFLLNCFCFVDCQHETSHFPAVSYWNIRHEFNTSCNNCINLPCGYQSYTWWGEKSELSLEVMNTHDPTAPCQETAPCYQVSNRSDLYWLNPFSNDKC